MRIPFKAMLCTSVFMICAATAPSAFAADTLEISDFIGTINWSNGDMKVDIENKGQTKVSGRKSLSIDGGQNAIDGNDCKSSYGSFSIDWFGKEKSGRFGGYENLEDFPILTVHIPEDTKVIIRNSIVFTEGTPNINEADIELRYCGALTLGDVTTMLALDNRGSADVTIGASGQIAANIKGSGDLVGGDSGDVRIHSNGSGDVELNRIASLDINSTGSGDFEAADVNGDVELSSRGSGDIELGDIIGSISYSGRGSGDLEVSSIDGAKADLTSSGSGDIDIDGGEVETLAIIANGSANIEFSGTADTATLQASGSGNIRVDRVKGDVDIRSSGSGDIDVEDRG